MSRWFFTYTNAATRRANAEKERKKLAKKGETLSPVQAQGIKLAKTFWGRAWCENLEAYSDYSNRLPRGRTYLRTGAVLDLQISKGSVSALVSGSSIYKIKIDISELPAPRWNAVVAASAGKIDSLLSLLQGKLSESVMAILTDRQDGLFPKPREIRLECSCPDAAGMCKHLAAVLYGVGVRLDQSPDLLFTLRGVNQNELIAAAAGAQVISQNLNPSPDSALAADDLANVFGIEIAPEQPPALIPPTRKPSRAKSSRKGVQRGTR